MGNRKRGGRKAVVRYRPLDGAWCMNAMAKTADNLGEGGAAEALRTPRELSEIAQGCFREGPLLLRKLQHYRPFICPFGELLPRVPTGSSVLDVGCGGGLWLALLRETGRISRGVGFDSSRRAIELAQTISLSKREGAGDLEFLELPAEAAWPVAPGGRPFDVVSIIDVLHHVPPAVAPMLFRNAAERLGLGGVLLYKDIYPGSWRSACNRLHDLMMARELIHLVPTEKVVGWAKDAGFELVYSERIDMLWYGHVVCEFRKRA
jgi:2-polyprenyl-3-methyl-5-hydroxy-6-metoxy-1,4-benzoquinol methylase